MAAYEEILARLRPQIELLVREISGKDYASLTELLRVTRMQELQRQIAGEMANLAAQTGDITAEAQARAVQASIASAEQMAVSAAANTVAAAAISSSWTNVPFLAVEDFIGASTSGPLADLIGTFSERIGQVLIDELTSAVARGTNPRDVAASINRAIDIGRNRALTITRTEMLRASRSAAQRNYQANSDILDGWRWTCAKQTRTCAACLAMDGTIHSLDETMPSHPNCRCTMVPVVKGVPNRKLQSGSAWLEKQSPDVQDHILGKAGGAAYRAGEVELQDFVKVTDSADWGKSVSDGGLGLARLNAHNRLSSNQSQPTLKDAEKIVESANNGGVFKRKLADGEFEKLIPWEVRDAYAAKTNNDQFEVKRIRIDNLIGEAETYDPSRVLSFVGQQIDPLIGPSILRYAGENYIMDGHHRILSRALIGDKTVTVRVYDMGEKQAENNDWLFPKKKRKAA